MKLTPGQLSLWDIEITKKPTSVTKTEGKFAKIEVLDIKRTYSFTENQEKVIEQYKLNQSLHRIIQYCGGGVGIELLDHEAYKTIYINTEGKEELSFNKKIPVLPMDKVLYYKEDLKSNSLQEEKLKELLESISNYKVIRKKGDGNILIELSEKVISINFTGMVLEFENVKAIYSGDEVIQEDAAENLETMQKRVKSGDFVQAEYGKGIIEGTIVHEYGLGNQILNIVFGNKHTAIGRMHVVKILKSA